MAPRFKTYEATVRSDETLEPEIDVSFKTLVRDMRLLGLSVELTSSVTPDGSASSRSDDPDDIDTGVAQTAELLGGQRVLRRAIRTRLDAHDLLKEGLPGHALQHLIDHVDILRASGSAGLENAVGISLRTVQRRKEAPDKRLGADQSGRAWKFAEILARTIELLGSQENAERWLATPAMALDGRKPVDLLSTPAGVEVIEDHLGRLEYGVYT